MNPTITLAPKDKDVANKLIQAVAANSGYCPCAVEQNEDTMCLCKAFRELEEGECHCGLYKKTLH